MQEYIFVKENETPIPVESVEDEHEDVKDFLPSFWWNNRRNYLEDFTPVRRTGCGEAPEGITLVQADNWTDPMYLEVLEENEGRYVNVYRERRRVY